MENDRYTPEELPIEKQRFTIEEISQQTGIDKEVLLALMTDNLPDEEREPTPKQLQVLNIVTDEIGRTGVTPTILEIARSLGVRSRGTVAGHLDALEAKGYIMRPFPRSRRLVLLQPPPNVDTQE